MMKVVTEEESGKMFNGADTCPFCDGKICYFGWVLENNPVWRTCRAMGRDADGKFQCKLLPSNKRPISFNDVVKAAQFKEENK